MANYLIGGGDDRVLWIASNGGVSSDPVEAASEMQELSEYNGRVEKPGIHLSVAFDPEDYVTKDDMLTVSNEVKAAVGMEDLWSVVVAHGDAYYPHYHELICRVDYWTNRAVDPSFPYYHVEQRLRELERAMGLREVPGKHGRLPDQTFERKHDRTWLRRADRGYVRAALKGASSWTDLEARLTIKGFGLRLDRNNLLITRGGGVVRAGAIQGGTSLWKMEARFGERFADYARSADARSAGVPREKRRARTEGKGAKAPVSVYRFSGGGEEASQNRGPAQEGRSEKAPPLQATPEAAKSGSLGREAPAATDIVRQTQELVDIEAKIELARSAVRDVSTLELWHARLEEMAWEAGRYEEAIQRLLRTVYAAPDEAFAHFQRIAAMGGEEELRAMLEKQPGRLGQPTRMGQSAEGEIVLQEAALQGAQYVELLKQSRDVVEDLSAYSELKGLRVVGEQHASVEAEKMNALLGRARAEEVRRVAGHSNYDASPKRGASPESDATRWVSPSLPKAASQQVREAMKRLTTRADVSSLYARKLSLEKKLRGQIRGLSRAEKEALREISRTLMDEAWRERVLQLGRAENERARPSLGR